jgi:hypothetical protein
MGAAPPPQTKVLPEWILRDVGWAGRPPRAQALAGRSTDGLAHRHVIVAR